MKKRIVALLGSPHETGSTAPMLSCTVKGTIGNGWGVTVTHLYEKQTGYCQGCRACMGTGICVHHDDLQEVAGLIKSCDRVVLTTPTYQANVPAVVKNLFDRLLGTAVEKTAAFPHPRLSPDQGCLLLTACNTPYPFSWIFDQSRGTIWVMNEFFKTSGMKKLGTATFAEAKGRSYLSADVQKRIIHALK